MILDEIPCRTWSELVEYVGTYQLPLALSKDKRLTDAAKNVDAYGVRGSAAILCAEIFMDNNDAKTAARWACDAYKRVSPDNQLIIDVPHSLAWAGVPREPKWAIEPEFESKEEEAGMANVLFHLSAVEFMKDGHSNSDLIAASSIVDFLKKGMDKKEGIKWNSKLKD